MTFHPLEDKIIRYTRDLMHFDYGGDRGRFGSLAQESRSA